MSSDAPDLAALRAAVADFAKYTGADRPWEVLVAATAPGLDLAVAEHRVSMLRWLNSWGCRIRYPRQGEPDVFDVNLARWWDTWRDALPDLTTSIADLSEATIAGLGDCYAELAAMPAAHAARPRSLGPTAAAKLLYALRPLGVMPWDEMIARHLHGARDSAAYAAHQRLGRDWARALLAEAGTDEHGLSVLLGRPGRPLAKMLDEYCYIAFTRDAGRTA
ncbi:hypothetical protein F0L68_25250 [Solihabitans fulvus]|uniref:Uncharacterized protein n=1 Tax=Solihabitans fulvus TaxID=1892852 RepID=A0A5B2X204_9PSEU|nr:hypothetical protein [Solihabitans fulvus]KAA2257267.1 hypothetical protein F0L68_25250 [Solihabitans fulvus]